MINLKTINNGEWNCTSTDSLAFYRKKDITALELAGNHVVVDKIFISNKL